MKFSHIEISKIDPNPNNPRGIEIASQDKKLPFLKDSIKTFGILVPLVVTLSNNRYLLIDGERRFVAAKALGLKKVPAYINDKVLKDKELLYQMFQIHHNREQWEPVQQCKALEIPYKVINNRSAIKSIEDEEVKIQAIAEELSRETGIEQRTAITRVYFLRWPIKIKDELYKNPSTNYWYICEIEEKIIIPAMRNYPEYFNKVPVDEVRVDLYRKLEAHSVGRATDVREVSKITRSNMTKPDDRKKVLRIFSELHKNKEMTYLEAKEDFMRYFPELYEMPVTPRKLLNALKNIETMIQSFDIDKRSEFRGRSRVPDKELKMIAKSVYENIDLLLSKLN